MASSPPNSRTNLDKAIQRLYGQRARFVEARSILARTVVGQFLPDAVAKGGGALQLRFGGEATRATFDFDAARRGALDLHTAMAAASTTWPAKLWCLANLTATTPIVWKSPTTLPILATVAASTAWATIPHQNTTSVCAASNSKKTLQAATAAASI